MAEKGQKSYTRGDKVVSKPGFPENYNEAGGSTPKINIEILLLCCDLNHHKVPARSAGVFGSVMPQKASLEKPNVFTYSIESWPN